jgi:hypothetical protein
MGRPAVRLEDEAPLVFEMRGKGLEGQANARWLLSRLDVYRRFCADVNQVLSGMENIR